jgi:hypothetical protein
VKISSRPWRICRSRQIFHSEATFLGPRARGRCYDHNFLRFLSIFGEKIGVFLKNQCYDQNFAYLSQKSQLFRWLFRRKYFKNHNIVPRSRDGRVSLLKILTNCHQFRSIKVASMIGKMIKIDLSWSKLIQIGQNWFKLVKIDSNWSKLIQIGQNWFKLVKIDSNWSKLIQIGSNW